MKHLYRTLMAITICLVLLAPLPGEADSLRDAAGRIDSSTTLPPATFTVNTDNDVDDGTCDATHCSLREAINAAKANAGTDIIAFDIAGPGPHPIEPLSPLPNITGPVIIDGTTEPDFAGTPIIELDGSHAGASADGLHITAGDSTVMALVIRQFSGDAIELATNGGNSIQGNFLGTDFTGTLAGFGNGTGVRISNVPNNTIGEGNVISANGAGVLIEGSSATGNRVQGSFIGTDVTGTADLGNAGEGVLITAPGAPGNIIGGATVAERNIISANSIGVRIRGNTADGNLVLGNYIGTDVNGTADLGNDLEGVRIEGAPNTGVGGQTTIPGTGQGNLISGNDGDGIKIVSGATGTSVLGNLIGTNASGTGALGNGADGIRISDAPDNTIGGDRAGARNIISGNDGAGVRIESSGATGNLVQGNFIGTDVNGTADLGNVFEGVIIENASDNTLGGTAAGAGNLISGNGKGIAVVGNRATINLVQGNTIAFNDGDGVFVESGTGNAIRANSIISNAGLGIDLMGGTENLAGVTENDSGDSDSGPNNLQNFPVLTSVSIFTYTTTVEGTLNSAPTTTFTIEFFSNAVGDPSGYGEGQTLLGSATETTDAAGNVSFKITLPGAISIFDTVTATATDPSGNTSEFSKGLGFIIVNSTADPGTGSCDATECTLREAITLANSEPNIKDSIVFNMPADDPNNRHFYYLDDGQPGQVSTANITVTTATHDSDDLSGTIDPDHPHSWWSIQPNSSLPQVTAPAIIDGYTVAIDGGMQSLASPASETAKGVLRIELDGTNLNPGGLLLAPGLSLGAGSTTVRGLAINRFASQGVHLKTGGGNVVAGNYIGTDISGLVALGNGKGVLIWGANDNTIGGTTPQARNLISGQSQEGVFVAHEYAAGTSKRNVVRGNYIGTDVTGNKALPNGVGVEVGASDNTIGPDNVISGNNGAGIVVRNPRNVIQGNRIGTNAAGTASLGNGSHGLYVIGSDNTMIGGTTPDERNVISGNGGSGILQGGSINVVQGNFIGTNATGTGALGNAGPGVSIVGSQNRIGGTTSGARNVISGNAGTGIEISSQNNDIQGNLIGTDKDGTAAIPNGGHGVYIGDVNNRVGGTADGAGNVISGNAGDGVAIVEDSNTVQGNLIGTAADGVSPLGNQGHGVSLLSGCRQGTGCADNNTIGGTASGAANTIAYNGGDGVSLSFAGPYLFDNDIRSNSIFSNTGLGIDLGDNGLTVNDPGDGDGGPNKLQNYPELNMVSLSAGQVTITYTVPSTTTHSAYPLTVEFFKADADGQEGQTFLGSDTYTTTEARRQKTVTFTPAAPVTHGDQIVATATDDDGNTSEFSPSRAAGVTVFIDDDFDDGDLATNTTGVVSGWSSGSNYYGAGGSETDSAFRFDGRSLDMGTLYEISSHENFYFVAGPGGVVRFHSGNVEVTSIYSDLDWRHQFAVVSANEPKSGSGGDATNNEVNLYRNTEGGLYINIYYDRETGDRDLSVSGDIRFANKNKVGSNSDDSIADLFTPATFTIDGYDGQSELITTIAVNQSGWSVGFSKNISATLNAGGVSVAGNTIRGDWSSNSLDDAAITDDFDYGAYLFAFGQNMKPYAGVGDVGRIVAAPDADADGVADDVEDGAPKNGDGNNDGTPDSQQANVTSLPNAADGGYVTLASPAGTGLGNVSAVGNPSPGDAPPGVGFPLGFFDYTVQGITPGGSVTVTLFLTPGVTINTYYKFGPTPGNTTPHWYKFMFYGTTGAQILADRVILHFVDGQRGDDDLAADGKIVEPGSPALQPGADLTLNKSDAPDPVFVGQPLTYTLTIANNGPDDATGVTLTDTLPADAVYSSAAPSQGTCIPPEVGGDGGVVTCNLGALTTTDTMTVTLVVSPTAAVTLNNTADVAADQPDPNPNNNTATISTTAVIYYDLPPWWTVDGGGAVSSGGGYSLYGTAGQPDAGALTGGDYTLTGGLWGAVAAPPPTCPGDLTYDKKVDVQDIMLAANGWRKQEGQIGYHPQVDRNGDKKITVDEIQWIATRWGTCE